MDSVFDRDTAVHLEGERSAGRASFRAEISRDWQAGRGPHGGYQAAILLRALTEAVADAARIPRSLTIHYASPPKHGPVLIHTTIERAGRSLSTASARMEQEGVLTALALAAFSVPWEAPDVDRLPIRALAPPDPERVSTPGLFDAAPGFTRQLVMQPRVGAIPFTGADVPMEIGGWLGLPEPRPVDPLALALFSDAWFPPSFIALDSPAISPTVDLTIHFREDPAQVEGDPAALCLGIFTTRLLHDGFFEEDGVIWAADGSVLAQSRQLGIIMPTDKPVLRPRKGGHPTR
jgi:acyl-CoA thioesterase